MRVSDDEIEEMVMLLHAKDDKIAYKNLQDLEALADKNDTLYKFMDEFVSMLSDEKSFVRVRGFRLICANAKWDSFNKIDKNIKKILDALDDEKPTAVRQMLAALQKLVPYKKVLHNKLKQRLLKLDFMKYKDSMQGLIAKDIDKLVELI